MSKTKNYSWDTVNQIQIGETIEVLDKDTGENKMVKAVDRAEICSVLAYMAGINLDKWEGYYSHNYSAILTKLQNSKEATIVRYLSRIRTVFLNYFLEIDSDLRNLINIDRNSKFYTDEIKKLISWQIPVVITNAKAEEYVAHINNLINKYIDKCKDLFPKSIKFAYIRNLFVTADKPETYKEEYNKYRGNKNNYPFQCYIHWEPYGNGYIFADDKHFLTNLYSQNGDTFYESYKLRSATESTKQVIYDFIGKSYKIIFFVDCENSDPYKLCKFFNELDQEQIKLIDKVVLYDDENTTIAWEYFKNHISVPVVYNLIERVAEHKSLVDYKMVMGITKASLQDNVDSFVICSSDSDFWSVMDDVDGSFLVLYEDSKCSNTIKDVWNYHGVLNFSLDDFNNGSKDMFKEAILTRILLEKAPEMFGLEPMEFAKMIFREAYIQATREELSIFCDEYIKRLVIKTDNNGKLTIGLSS